MKFGIMYSFIFPPGSSMTHRDTFREMDRLLPLAEDLGFDAFHTTEHHFQDNGWAPSPLVVLAQAAGLTKRMRLVTNIIVLPLYEPLRLVEDLLTLDNVCDGRLTLGVSPGYVSEEFTAYGIPHNERFLRSEEILDIIETAWANESFRHDGKYYRIPETRVMPRPIQTRLPIWYGVSGPKLLERAARRRCPVTASPRHTIPELQEHYFRYDAAAKEVGFETAERPVIREVFIAPTTARAEEIAGPAVTHLFGLYGRKSAEGERELRNDSGELIRDESQVDFKTFASRYIIGDPASAREQLEELVDALSPSEIICRMQLPGIPTDDFERSIRLFGEEVLPAFQ
jgi:alkanesulfonate monooxygenase SsuD/methylene tetrahydromethanopterin reductase-like flavin-dependent oxidoreductase (luciferase family)